MPSEVPQPPFRILVIATESVDGHMLHDTLLEHAGTDHPTEVLVVCPALNSRLRFWVSDVDPARRAAAERLRDLMNGLSGDGIEAAGSIGDSDPVQAIADSLRQFRTDEIVLVTHPHEQEHWIEHGLVDRVREQLEGRLPLAHIVVADHLVFAAA
jgi:hypothetical protein